MLAITFKRGLLIEFQLSRKLHKPKYEYITMSKCFNKVEETVASNEEYRQTRKPIKSKSVSESSRVEWRVEEPSPKCEQIRNNRPWNQNDWSEELSTPLYNCEHYRNMFKKSASITKSLVCKRLART